MKTRNEDRIIYLNVSIINIDDRFSFFFFWKRSFLTHKDCEIYLYSYSKMIHLRFQRQIVEDLLVSIDQTRQISSVISLTFINKKDSSTSCRWRHMKKIDYCVLCKVQLAESRKRKALSKMISNYIKRRRMLRHHMQGTSLSSKEHVQRTHLVFCRSARHDGKFVTRLTPATRIVWLTELDDKSTASFSLSNSSSYMRRDSSKRSEQKAKRSIETCDVLDSQTRSSRFIVK
jgi:hypothetical protein